MSRFQTFYASTIGKKFIAAVTGLILFGFVFGHMAGNLKIFTGTTDAGVPHMDEYGHFLRIVGQPLIPAYFALWAARVTLLAALILHIVVVVQLAMLSSEARPVDYVKSKKRAATLPALWMLFSGLAIFGFIIFHILHLTAGVIPLGEKFEHGYVYNNVAYSFAKWPVALGYIGMMVVLGIHLNHGVWSMFQTIGLDNPDRNKMLRIVTTAVTAIIMLGFIAVPIAFLSGMMPEPVSYPHELLKVH